MSLPLESFPARDLYLTSCPPCLSLKSFIAFITAASTQPSFAHFALKSSIFDIMPHPGHQILSGRLLRLKPNFAPQYSSKY